MNYQKIYNDLIGKARKEERSKPKRKESISDRKDSRYFENHHILPVACGGTDEKFNMVLLTGREHWIAHCLLVKIYKKEKSQKYYAMNQALINMGRLIDPDKRKNSKLYQNSRQIISEQVSNRHKGTLVVKDKETGIMIGRVDKNHPKILSGEWIFFHKGRKKTEKELECYNKGSMTGKKNANANEISNEKIIELAIKISDIYGCFSIGLLIKHSEKYWPEYKIPKSWSGEYRRDTFKNLHRIVSEKTGINEKELKRRYKGKI